MKPVFVDQRLDLGQFGDLMDRGGRVITDQGMATAAAIRGPAIGNRSHFSGGTKLAGPCDVPVARPVSDQRVGREACA